MFKFPDTINFEASFSSTSLNDSSDVILGLTKSDAGNWSYWTCGTW